MPSNRPPREGLAAARTHLATALAVAVLLAFIIWAPFFRESGWGLAFWPEVWRYADSGTPMLLEWDAYHYLERAGYALRHGEWRGIPFLSLLAAQGAKFLPATLEQIAFLLPIFFSLALAALTLAWGALLGLAWPARMAGTAACLMVPAWLERSGPGWFDTDPLIAVFWQGSILGLAWLSAPRPAARAIGAAGALASGAILLPLAYHWGPHLAALTFGVWLVLPPSQGGCPYFGERARRALWGGLAALALVCALTPDNFLPGYIVAAKGRMAYRLSQGFGEKRADIFFSIAEMRSLNAWEWLEKLGGSTPGGLLVSLAALAAFFAFPVLRPALWLSVPFLVMGSLAQRFMYLGALMPAFCVGLLPAALRRLPGKAGRNKALRAGAVGAVLVCLAISAVWAAKRSYSAIYYSPHDAMLLRLRDIAPQDAALWNWWDDGYILKARTGLTPLFDGGSPTVRMASIAARPLAMDDPATARRWIRFFALRGSAAIESLDQAWGKSAALDCLEQVLRASDPRTALAGRHSLNRDAQWLFPEGRVFLFLPRRFLSLSRTWVKFAMPWVPDINHIQSIPAADLEYDERGAAVRPPEYLFSRGYTGFGAIIVSPLGPPWPTTEAPYIVYSPSDPSAYIVNEVTLRSLAMRLFTAGPSPVPGFDPVSVDPDWGGVWEVLP